MEKKIIIDWSEKAINDLQEIRDFIAVYSEERADLLVDNIFKRVGTLETGFLKMGQVEELLPNESYEYRYLVEGFYKIIYRLNNGKAEISRIFDTRQSPEKIKK